MRTLLLLTMTVLALSACTTIDSKKKASTFETAMFRYSKAIRWGEFGLADSMRRLPEGQHPVQSTESLEHIRITSYETLSTGSLDDGAGVKVVVRIVFYHDDGVTLNTLTDNQVWEYDDDTRSWYITTPLPVFR